MTGRLPPVTRAGRAGRQCQQRVGRERSCVLQRRGWPGEHVDYPALRSPRPTWAHHRKHAVSGIWSWACHAVLIGEAISAARRNRMARIFDLGAVREQVAEELHYVWLPCRRVARLHQFMPFDAPGRPGYCLNVTAVPAA